MNALRVVAGVTSSVDGVSGPTRVAAARDRDDVTARDGSSWLPEDAAMR